LPAASPDWIRESGAPVSQARGIMGAQSNGSQVTIAVGSGRYSFEAALTACG